MRYEKKTFIIKNVKRLTYQLTLARRTSGNLLWTITAVNISSPIIPPLSPSLSPPPLGLHQSHILSAGGKFLGHPFPYSSQCAAQCIANNTDWGVRSWPWKFLALRKVDHPFFVVTSRHIPVQNTLDLSAVVLLLLLLLLRTAIEFSHGCSSPYTSTDKTNKDKYT